MPNPRAHMRSSRRAPILKDSDIDHEIDLVDHSPPRTTLADADNSTEPDADVDSALGSSLLRPHSPGPEAGTSPDSPTITTDQPLEPSDSQAPLAQPLHGEAAPSSLAPSVASDDASPSKPDDARAPSRSQRLHRSSTSFRSSVARLCGRTKLTSQHYPVPPKTPETDIDILYENQRGGFLCGLPLFSSAALGNLDPPAWTNFAHKPSPTNIHTAQVPDPSWEWAWPEWRVNHDDAVQADKEGWEYSFMFSKKFSWHGPKWWNSYVRRRAWIRRRIKKGSGYLPADPHSMNPEYFQVTPAKRKHLRTPSWASNLTQKPSDSQLSRASHIPPSIPEEDHRASRLVQAEIFEEFAQMPEEVRTAEELMPVLRRCRIDREKMEAVENYIQHSTDDLSQLQEFMHEIMSIFVFQASRKLLLSRLTQLHEEYRDPASASTSVPKDKEKAAISSSYHRKADNLQGAIKHADEEVRRLEYWSDIKGMAESGQSEGAVKAGEGLDKSGAKGP